MASILGFGAYVPDRVLGNDELAAELGVEPSWIVQVSGIHERRVAARGETLTDLAVAAAHRCLRNTGKHAEDVGLLLVASGSAERRFPGPAVEVGRALGIPGTPCLDLPLASAGGLAGMTLASHLAALASSSLWTRRGIPTASL